MPMWIKNAGIWKDSKPYIKNGGVWKEVQEGHIKDGGTWKPFYTALPPVYLELNHASGYTAKANPSATAGLLYEVDSDWYYIAKGTDTTDITAKMSDVINNSRLPGATVSITDDNSVTKSIPINNIVTSRITSFFNWRAGKSGSLMDQYIDQWDMSNVTNMSFMLSYCQFNQSIAGWDTSNVTNMSSMYLKNSLFNQNIGGWNTGKVTDMSGIFSDASAFNQNIGSWNTSNVTNMSSMFAYTSVFNQNIGGWNTGKVTNMGSMFAFASVFNQNIGGWNTGKVTNMIGTFRDASAFNQDLSGWCVSLIGSKPVSFDARSGFEGVTAKQPQWGTCP